MVAVLVAAAVVVVLVVSGGSDSNDTASGTTVPKSGAEITTVVPTTNGAKPVSGGICSGKQLVGDQSSSGLSGTTQTGVFVFTNQSKTECTVNGSVTVQLADENGKDLPTNVTTGGGAVPASLTASEVTLAPGGQASVVMSWSPIAVAATPGCSDAKQIKVTMPGSDSAVKIDTRMNVCANGALNISPVQTGIASA